MAQAAIAHALNDSTVLAVKLGAALADLQAAWRETAGRPRRTSATQRLIGLLATRPVIDITTAATQLDVSYPQAREAVLRLGQANVLRPVATHTPPGTPPRSGENQDKVASSDQRGVVPLRRAASATTNGSGSSRVRAERTDSSIPFRWSDAR